SQCNKPKARWIDQRAATCADTRGDPSGDFARKRFRAKTRDLPAAFPDDLPGLGDLSPLCVPGGIRTGDEYERLIDQLARIDTGAPCAVDIVWLTHSPLLVAGGSTTGQFSH
ncbi:MAG: hypothetical protein R3D52_15110, partial [Xanthobacteraceae bacterium]